MRCRSKRGKFHRGGPQGRGDKSFIRLRTCLLASLKLRRNGPSGREYPGHAGDWPRKRPCEMVLRWMSHRRGEIKGTAGMPAGLHTHLKHIFLLQERQRTLLTIVNLPMGSRLVCSRACQKAVRRKGRSGGLSCRTDRNFQEEQCKLQHFCRSCIRG